VDTLLSDRRGV